MRYLIALITIMALAMVATVRADSTASRVGPGTQPRTYREVPDRLYNSTFANWGQVYAPRKGLTDPDALEAEMRQWAEAGITGFLYNGRHLRLSYPYEWEQIKTYTRMVTDAAHRHGLLVIEHHDVTLVSYNNYPLALAHPEWLQADVRTGEPTRWFNGLHPGFQQLYAAYLADFQRATNVDGYMLDELTAANRFVGGSPQERRSVLEMTGAQAPQWMWGDARDAGDESVRSLRAWQGLIEPTARRQLFTAVKRIRPDAIQMTYGSSYINPAAPIDLALAASQFSGFVGLEARVFSGLEGWEYYLRDLKVRNSLGDYYQIPIFAYIREARNPEQSYFLWAGCQLTRHSAWLAPLAVQKPEDFAELKKHVAWKHAMPHKWARCLTDTALVLSHQTRRANSDPNFFWHDFEGWAAVLTETSRQFDTLLDGDLELSDRLGKYRLLVLPSQACLSDRQVEHLERWVQQGGTAVVTRHTALYDQLGQARKQPILQRAMNIALPPARPEYGGVLAGRIGKTEISTEAVPRVNQVRVVDPSRSRVLASVTFDDGKKWPAVVETRHGAGRFIYVAADLGYSQDTPELYGRVTYPGPQRPDLRATMNAILDYAASSSAPAELELPEGVVGTVYQQYDGPQKGDVYLQLLNVRGKTLKGGEKGPWYGRNEPIRTPAVDEPIRLRLRLKAGGPAEVRSPTVDQPVHIPATEQDGTWVVEVPGRLLQAYAQVRIPAELWPSIVPPPVPVVEPSDQALPEPSSEDLLPALQAVVPSTESDERSPTTFSLGQAGQAEVRLNELTIISADAIGTPGTATLDRLIANGGSFEHAQQGWRGSIASGSTPEGIRWVREVASRGDVVEISLAQRRRPVDHGLAGAALSHKLYLPVSLLKGAEYTARVNEVWTHAKQVGGQLTGQEPEGKVILDGIRLIQFTRGAADFSVDTNPAGPWRVFYSDPSTAVVCQLWREGESYVLAIPQPFARWGGDFCHKIVIRAGEHDLNELHPVWQMPYYWPVVATKRIQFTAAAPVTGFAPVPQCGLGWDREFVPWKTQPFSKIIQMGWKSQTGGEIVPAPPDAPLGPLFGGGFRGSGDAIFALSHPDGVMFTCVLLSGAAGPSAGQVRVNGGEPVSFNINAGDRRTLIIPTRVADQQVQIALSGPQWLLSGVVVQPLFFENEDYRYGRCWWALGTPPWKLASFADKPAWHDWPDVQFGPVNLFPQHALTQE